MRSVVLRRMQGLTTVAGMREICELLQETKSALLVRSAVHQP